MKIEQRLKIALKKSKGDVFLREEFNRYASKAYVARGLKSLTDEGILIKLGRGIYAKSKTSILTGKTIPIRPLEVLAPQALAKMGVKMTESRLVHAYNLGKTTQIPAGIMIAVGDSRITRRIKFGNQVVVYEKNKRRTN